MTTFSRLNTTIADHASVANYIALCLLASGAIVGSAALGQTGALTKAYDSVFQSAPVAQTAINDTPATRVQAPTTELTVANSSPTSLQNQSQPVATQLQPANDATYFQGNTNNIQLTGSAQQNVAGTNLQ